jgi:hypothetical protein
MAIIDYTLEFATVSEAVEGYGLKRLPVNGQDYYAGYRYDDDGRKVKLFARKHYGNRAKFTFSEVAA